MSSILYVGEFDPCGVGLRQRTVMRQRGHDFRIAVRDAWREEAMQADYLASNLSRLKRDEMMDFAASCDLLVFCPAISQAWSCQESATPRYAEPLTPLPHSFRRAGRKLALLHGSPSLAPYAENYATAYREAGWELAATTLDYATRLGVAYVPSVVDVPGFRAHLRNMDEPLRIIHTPTSPRLCSSAEFESICEVAGVSATVYAGTLSHADCLETKSVCHAGFDHLRGSFSINSLENAMLGLVNLVGSTEASEARLLSCSGLTMPWPRIRTLHDLSKTIHRLRDDPVETSDLQAASWSWMRTHWLPEHVAARIEDAYGIA